MNQRIRELAEQAEWRFADKATGEFSEYDKRLEKFAELIVRECADIAEKWYSDYPSDDRLLSDAVKQHFGVER